MLRSIISKHRVSSNSSVYRNDSEAIGALRKTWRARKASFSYWSLDQPTQTHSTPKDRAGQAIASEWLGLLCFRSPLNVEARPAPPTPARTSNSYDLIGVVVRQTFGIPSLQTTDFRDQMLPTRKSYDRSSQDPSIFRGQTGGRVTDACVRIRNLQEYEVDVLHVQKRTYSFDDTLGVAFSLGIAVYPRKNWNWYGKPCKKPTKRSCSKSATSTSTSPSPWSSCFSQTRRSRMAEVCPVVPSYRNTSFTLVAWPVPHQF